MGWECGGYNFSLLFVDEMFFLFIILFSFLRMYYGERLGGMMKFRFIILRSWEV